MEKYKFNEKRHLHELYSEEKGEYVALTGCTTILGVIAKPALIQWSSNLAVQTIKEKATKENDNYIVPEELLEEARLAHRKTKEKAGDFGTKLHKEIEELIIQAIKDKEIKELPTTTPQAKKFIEWVKENKVKFLESEKNIYSKEYWIGGIVDIVCEIDGEVWIADIKTAKSGIYAENFFQMAGYEIMLNECSNYKNIKGYIVLNIKENGEFLEKRSVSNEENKNAFRSALNLYRTLEKIKNQII